MWEERPASSFFFFFFFVQKISQLFLPERMDILIYFRVTLYTHIYPFKNAIKG